MDAIESSLGELGVPLRSTIPSAIASSRERRSSMRRLFANRLALATAVAVVVMAIVFALCA